MPVRSAPETEPSELADVGPRAQAPLLETSKTDRWWRDARRRRMLAAADVLAGLAAVAVSPVRLPLTVELVLAVPIVLLSAKLTGLYDLDHRKVRHLTVDELSTLLAWAVASMVAVGIAGSLITGSAVRLGPIMVAVGAAFIFGVAFRAAARSLWRRTTPPELTIVVGGGALRRTIERKIEIFPDMHIELVDRGLDAESAADLHRDELRVRREMRGVSDYRDALEGVAERVDRMIVAHDAIEPSVLGELVGICRARQVKLSVVSPLSGRAQPPVMTSVAELPVMEYDTSDVSWSTALLKRAMDIVLSTLGLIVTAPVLVAIAAAVAIDSRGSVLFVQRRAGLHGAPFGMLKFRSMTADAESRLGDLVSIDSLKEPMFKLQDDPRVTRVGRWLRRTSLDELPQLWNVLRGDMSIVGPRPEEVKVVERYRPEHRFRLDVRPGLTGPMQVFGRGALTFSERLAVELDYVENASLGRDLQILMLTLPAVVRGSGAF